MAPSRVPCINNLSLQSIDYAVYYIRQLARGRNDAVASSLFAMVRSHVRNCFQNPKGLVTCKKKGEESPESFRCADFSVHCSAAVCAFALALLQSTNNRSHIRSTRLLLSGEEGGYLQSVAFRLGFIIYGLQFSCASCALLWCVARCFTVCCAPFRATRHTASCRECEWHAKMLCISPNHRKVIMRPIRCLSCRSIVNS